MAAHSKRIVLASRPRGELSRDNFRSESVAIPDPAEGELLVRTMMFSVDPYMRNRMNDAKSYVRPYEVDQPLTGDAIGEVVAGNHTGFQPGDIVTGSMPWQEYTNVSEKRLEKVDKTLGDPADYLGILGLTGLTAYFGLLEIGQPKSGENVVVSGAAGATGLVAGQIAKLKGCTVTGIAGSEEKVQYLAQEAGFDHVINYKSVPNVRKPLRNTNPDGIDVYFDNVGGEISDSVMYMIRDHARIVLCGQIAMYNAGRIETGPRLLPQLIIHRARMQGFIVYDYRRDFAKARIELSQWIHDGKIKQPRSVVKGFDQLPEALLGLFAGKNLGKQLVQV